MSAEPGQLIVHTTTDPTTGAKTHTAEWEGAPVIWISRVLLDDELADPAVLQRDGDSLTICQFKLRITGRHANGDYVAERVDA